MRQLAFFKWPLILFLFGLGVRMFGALLKIRHWPFGNESLTIGTIICIAAILLAIIKLLLLKKQD